MSDANFPASDSWVEVAQAAFRSPGAQFVCPRCHAPAVHVAWHLVDFLRRQAAVDLHCAACQATESLQTGLPSDAPGFFPIERGAMMGQKIQEQVESIASRIQDHAKTMPAAAFTTHPLWVQAKWSATTFRWHPTSEAPPIMGLVFDDAEAGREIFRAAERQMNHTDRFEEIRVSIIEGPVSGEEKRPGYSVHICADPEALNANATAADFVVDPSIVPFLGQWNRHYPVPGTPALLPRFKSEFARHKEFLLAPVVRKQDGQLWVEPELGIIKNEIHFRNLMDITQDDPDAAAVILPQFIMPPES